MLGSGIFVLPAFAAHMMGDGIWVAYLVAAAIVLPSAISKSELATAMPSSGGSYVYCERTFGALIGTIAGLGLWSSFLLKSAFALIGFQAYLFVVTDFLGAELNAMSVSLSFLVLIVGLNIMGVKKVKAVQVPLTMLIVVVMLFLCGAAVLLPEADLMRPLRSTAFRGEGMQQQIVGVGKAAAFVFVAYLGVTNVAAIAGEVKSPEKNLHRGILISLGISTFLYVLVGYTLTAVVPAENLTELDKDGNKLVAVKDSINHLAQAVGGDKLGLAIAVLAILTMASMALAGLLAASRFGFAMAQDSLLPQSLENVNARFETPHWAVIITGLVMAVVIWTLPVADIAKLVSGFKIMIFCLENLIVIILRATVDKKKVESGWYDPTYRSPLFPYTQLLGIAGGVFLLYLMGEKAAWGAMAVSGLGIVTFFGYGRYHAGSRRTPFEDYRARLLNPTHDEYELETVPIQQFREMMRNPTRAEHDRRVAAFNAADAGRHQHLTLSEFQRAMHVLGYDYYDLQLREIFHAADASGDGVIVIEEFLAQFEGELMGDDGADPEPVGDDEN
jgi:basic amino acid/polyamine antiporter, APA family